jgi:hypothetical protein
MNSKRAKLTKFYLPLLLVLLIGACNQGEKSDHQSDNNGTLVDTGPVITFDKDLHDFGKIINGEKVSYAFRFTNEGTGPLLITGIRSGCGCTVGDFPKEPIMPNEIGRINVVFNSAGRRGFQSETVRVFTNTGEQVSTLRIQAEVTERL